MKKQLIFVLIFLGVTSIGYGQLTSNQKELLEKYKKNYSQTKDSDTERYATPPIYDEMDDSLQTKESFKKPSLKSDYKDQKNQKRQKYDLDDTTIVEVDSLQEEEPELKLFGYDIFENADETFKPGINDLPPDSYTFGPGDNVLVNVWGRVNIELVLTVDREGKVFVPKVGDIIAAGATLEQFKERLNEKLSKAYSGYNLSVSYGKLRQITVYVFGEVKKPGGYTMSSLANMLNALYIAGGITETGSLRNIQIIRNTRVAGTYDLYSLLLKGDNGGDLKLFSGDVVHVPVIGPLVAISGEVKRPAIYELNGNETVVDALKLAGGLTPEAYLASISLDRVGPNDSRLLLDLDLADSSMTGQSNTMLQDGDKLNIYSIYDFHENLVQLTGHVKHPGLFGLIDGMGILDLIDYGEQLKENTYIKRADLYRTNDDATKTLITINLEAALAGDTLSNIPLEPMDSVAVYSYDQVNREKLVHISGEVKNPGDYQLYNSMKISDLIFQAGNITRQASLVRCEIARVHSGNQTEIIKINLEDVLLKSIPQKDIELAEDDCVFIRSIPDWRPVQMITVEGEVMFPGQYAIRNKDEHLSDIIARAGGLAPSAFPEGAIYIRKSIEKQVEQRNIGQIIVNTQELVRDTSGNIITDYQFKYDPFLLNRIVIDLPGLLAAPGSPKDIVIADSDYVYIPTHPSGVQVIGSVAFNGTITYAKSQKAKYYLSQAGGLTPDGDDKGMRLVKANGKVYYGRKAKRQKIELGDAIVVPSRIKKNTDWSKTLTTTATIVGSMATTILVVDRLK